MKRVNIKATIGLAYEPRMNEIALTEQSLLSAIRVIDRRINLAHGSPSRMVRDGERIYRVGVTFSVPQQSVPAATEWTSRLKSGKGPL